MNITCPGCETAYLLPRTLLGREGARVKCPSCGRRFRVSPAGGVEPDDSPAPRQAAAPSEHARSVAREVLTDLQARIGGELADAIHHRELFQRHGPALLAAFDEYRQRAGARAGSEAFRSELRELWGLDLFPTVEQGPR